MDVNKNSYTFIFAFVMVVVVAAILSFTAITLKPAQDENVRREKMQNILASIGVNVERDEAGKVYNDYITQELVIKNNQVQEGVNAFNVDMAKQMDFEPLERQAPLYVAENQGQTYFVLPLRGKGLWGPVWGYISLESDGETVYGAVFDHKSETPGLGAEISTAEFMDQFEGKKIMDESGEFVGIQVTKKPAQGNSQVDGISGGTITSVGVEDMITDCMQSYLGFLEENKEQVAEMTTHREMKLAIKE